MCFTAGPDNAALQLARFPLSLYMALITMQDAQLAFGHVALLDHAQLSLETGERIGLIGRNGAGGHGLGGDQ